jgi:hypothetical protein
VNHNETGYKYVDLIISHKMLLIVGLFVKMIVKYFVL